MQLINTLEGGVDETQISTGNSGGASGDAFSSNNIGAGNDYVFDTARASHGGISSRIDLGADSNTVSQIGWTFSSITEAWGYYYFYWTGTYAGGGSTIRVISFANGGASVGRIVIGRDAQVIQVSDQNFAGAATSTAGFTFNAWYRLGWHVVCSATAGFMEAALYLGDSTTPITNGTCATDSLRDTDVAITTVTYGCTAAWPVGSPAFSYWADTYNVNDQGDTGPYSAAVITPPTFIQMNRRG